MNIILGRAEMVLNQAPDNIAELARSIEDSGERLLGQTDKEREIVELLSEPSTPTTIDLVGVIHDVVARLETNHSDAEFMVETPDELHVTTIPEVERAIEELVENALIHTNQESPVVTITTREMDDAVEISITDTGPGIPPEEQKVITEETDVEPLIHSQGMGLWLVKRIITRANGSLRIIDEDSQGSTVTISIPRKNQYERGNST